MQARNLASLQNTAQSRSSTSLITPAVQVLSDPPARFVDAHLMEFMMAEVIRHVIESEAFSRTRREAQEKHVETDYSVASTSLATRASLLSLDEKPAAVTPEQAMAIQVQADEAVRLRLDNMGFKIGWALSERLARDRLRFPTSAAPLPSSCSAPSSTPLPPIPDPLETVKFICKDVWVALYDKQIDNLRTNHRGVYVLQDNLFKPLSRVSGGVDEIEVARKTKFFLAVPAGIIRGALANLGMSCTVTAETIGLPQTTFQIKTIKPGGN